MRLTLASSQRLPVLLMHASSPWPSVCPRLSERRGHFNELRIVILHSVALSIISSFFHLSPGCGLHWPSCIHVFTKRERAASTTGRCILPASVWGGGGVDGGGRVTSPFKSAQWASEIAFGVEQLQCSRSLGQISHGEIPVREGKFVDILTKLYIMVWFLKMGQRVGFA